MEDKWSEEAQGTQLFYDSQKKQMIVESFNRRAEGYEIDIDYPEKVQGTMATNVATERTPYTNISNFINATGEISGISEESKIDVISKFINGIEDAKKKQDALDARGSRNCCPLGAAIDKGLCRVAKWLLTQGATVTPYIYRRSVQRYEDINLQPSWWSRLNKSVVIDPRSPAIGELRLPLKLGNYIRLRSEEWETPGKGVFNFFYHYMPSFFGRFAKGSVGFSEGEGFLPVREEKLRLARELLMMLCCDSYDGSEQARMVYFSGKTLTELQLLMDGRLGEVFRQIFSQIDIAKEVLKLSTSS